MVSRLTAATIATVAAAGWAAPAAAQARSYVFDISNQTLAQALRSYGQISGEQIIFTESLVAGLKPAPLEGEYTAEAALQKLLEGTGLIAERSPSGALMIRRPADPVPAGQQTPSHRSAGSTPTVSVVPAGSAAAGRMRLAQAGSEAPARQGSETAGVDRRAPDSVSQPLTLEEIMITGRRIDGLNNQGLLQSGEDAALYHDIVTAEDIQRLGVSSIEELFRILPQTSSASTSLQEAAGNTQTTGGLTNRASTIGLRGFSSSQTVVLINGRALPRSHVFAGGGADLGRIPIAAIERVEILPYAGSAIYGAGAIGGAINIVLRKEYTGSDLSAYVGTATEGGTTEYRLTYLDGALFNDGRTHLTTTFSFQKRDPLLASDRDYLDEALRRYGPDSTVTDQQGRSVFETLILPAFAAAPGTIVVGREPSQPDSDLGIPGHPGVRYAALPAGLTAEEAAALTPESFVDTAGKANLAPRYGRSVLYEPIESYNLNMQWGHEFEEDRLEAYGEFTLGYNRKEYSMPQGFSIFLSETDPLNPFRTGVIDGFAGRPVTILLDTPDLPDPSVLFKDEYARTVVGLKGRMSPRWEWSADAVVDYARSVVDSRNPLQNLRTLTDLAPFVGDGTPADPEVRRAIYPVLADHTLYPVPAGYSQDYFHYSRYSATRSLQWEGNARVLGTLFELPAGPLQASVVGKYQYWDFHYGQRQVESDGFAELIYGEPSVAEMTRTPATRKVLQGALEISIPIISSRWRPLPIEALELQGSISRERHVSSSVNDEDTPFSYRKSASAGVIAMRLQATKDIALRASYSEGFYPPDWHDVGMPVNTMILPGFFPDPMRGNTLQFLTPGAPMMEIMQGGNPDLKPERATSESFGMILTPRFAPGLSLHVDYWRIEKVDAVVSTSFVNIISNPDAYGFLITRAPPSESDIANGWLGFITAVDARAFNAAIHRTQGVDFKLRYMLDTARLGTFDFDSGASFVDKFEVLATPTTPAIDTVGGTGPLRWRAHGSLTWSRNEWSVTLTGRYTGWRQTFTTTPSASFPSASGLDGDRIPSSLIWDLQVGYELPYGAASSSGLGSWLAGSRLTLGAINLFNEKPAFVSDGFAFYNSVEDPRQRVVYMQLRKSL